MSVAMRSPTTTPPMPTMTSAPVRAGHDLVDVVEAAAHEPGHDAPEYVIDQQPGRLPGSPPAR